MARGQNGFVMSKKKIETRLKNDQTFASYFYDLKNIAQSSFLYEDLPETINTDYFERVLFDLGMVAVFEEPEIGLVALPAIQNGGFNLYGLPQVVRAYSGFTGFSRMLRYNPYNVKNSDCVLIFNTGIDTTSFLFRGTIGAYAERPANIKRTEDINVYAQRTPVTMVVPQGQVETYVNTLDRYENFGKVVFGYKGMDLENIKALKTDAPFISGELHDLFTKEWNEAIGYLGVSNLSVYKKERVSTDEVARSMGGAIAHRNVRQNPREKAIDLINEKWGEKYNFKAKVSFNEALFDLVDDGTGNENIIGYNREKMNSIQGEQANND